MLLFDFSLRPPSKKSLAFVIFRTQTNRNQGDFQSDYQAMPMLIELQTLESKGLNLCVLTEKFSENFHRTSRTFLSTKLVSGRLLYLI